MFQGSCKDILRKFSGCLQKISRVFKESFKCISGKFLVCFKDESGKFQGWFKKVLRVFLEGFKGVSSMIEGCF